MEMINALSIDLEDWYHAELMAGRGASFFKRQKRPNPFWIC